MVSGNLPMQVLILFFSIIQMKSEMFAMSRYL